MIIYQSKEDVILRLKHPLGKLLIGPPEKAIRMLREEIENKNPTKLIAIGDVVSLNVLRSGLLVDCIVIDFKSKRQSVEQLYLDAFKIIYVKNPAGFITSAASEAVKSACLSEQATAIVVEGEEDLLTLPSIIFAPLRAFIVYGQPYVGIVLVKVTEKTKLEAELLMNKLQYFN